MFISIFFINKIRYKLLFTKYFINLFSCCESAHSPPGQKDACCHTKGFAVEPPKWQCDMDAGEIKLYSKRIFIQHSK